jgi:hypothetical protein
MPYPLIYLNTISMPRYIQKRHTITSTVLHCRLKCKFINVGRDEISVVPGRTRHVMVHCYMWLDHVTTIICTCAASSVLPTGWIIQPRQSLFHGTLMPSAPFMAAQLTFQLLPWQQNFVLTWHDMINMKAEQSITKPAAVPHLVFCYNKSEEHCSSHHMSIAGLLLQQQHWVSAIPGYSSTFHRVDHGPYDMPTLS